MFNQIKTSKDNKVRVAELTRKLFLGTENIVARIALTYSLSKERQLRLEDLKDSQGKEYSKNVLLGSNYDFYIAMICEHYKI
jgi:DNA sulfur modification protein DndE